MTKKQEAGTSSPQRPVRWKVLSWPVGVMLVLAVAALIWIWSSESPQRQDQVVRTMLLSMGSVTLLLLWSLIWVLLLSRMRWRVRLLVFAAVAIVLAGLRFSVTVGGFSGDVVPILQWRWSPKAGTIASPPDAPEVALTALPATSSPFDFPKFQGPRGDGSVPGVRLSRDWSEPPRSLWRQPIGAGWSGFAVAGALAVTQEQRGEQELVTCYERKTGRLRWSHADSARHEDPVGGPGPRATPAIFDGRVYALGATGVLNVLDLLTGERIWSRNVVEENGASVPTYGVAASPVLVDAKVVVLAGGADGKSLVAYDAATGEPVWSGGDGPPAYGTPRPAELAGTPQIVVQNGASVVGHDKHDGRVLWEHAWPIGGGRQNTFQPVIVPGNRVFVSAGYGVGGKMFRVQGGDADELTVELLWESLGLKAKFTNAVFHDGHLFGLDDGIMVCLDPQTGERRWKRGRYGHGQILLVDELLLVSGENGTVALVEADPEAYRELGRFSALSGKTWNHPALAGRYLLVRNDREAACYELPLER